jgi:outer membrane protein TolC
MYPCARLFAFALCSVTVLSPAISVAQQSVRPATNPSTSDPAARSLTIDDALKLGESQNRDLAAARARLKGSHADVERAMAALLPTLNVQGRLIINEPEVTVPFDQRVQTFSGLVQGGAVSDASLALAKEGKLQQGALTQALADYCRNATGANRDTVDSLCQQLINPASQLGKTPPTTAELDAMLTSANPQIVIQPRLQLDANIVANVPLLVPAAYPALQGAKLAYRAQERQLDVTMAQVLQSVATAFFAAAGAEELVAARTNTIEVAQKTVDNARVRLQAGVVNKVEVTRAELALIQAKQRLLESQDNRASAYRMLATMIRQPAGSFKVVPPPEPSTEMGAEDQLVDQALKSRPELLSLDLSSRAASSQVTSSWLRYSPNISLFGNIRLTNATGFAGRSDSYSFGAQLDWQVFDGFARDAQRHQFEAQRRDVELRLEQLRDSISDEVINARRNVITKRQGLVTAQRALQMAQETLNLVRLQYEAGTATQLDLLTSQDQMDLAAVGLAQARFDLSLSLIQLRRLIGSPLVG